MDSSHVYVLFYVYYCLLISAFLFVVVVVFVVALISLLAKFTLRVLMRMLFPFLDVVVVHRVFVSVVCVNYSSSVSPSDYSIFNSFSNKCSGCFNVKRKIYFKIEIKPFFLHKCSKINTFSWAWYFW